MKVKLSFPSSASLLSFFTTFLVVAQRHKLLQYFPMEEDWTLTLHPSKPPALEKFPAKYTLTQLKQQSQPTWPPANKPWKQHKQKVATVLANQVTLNQFIAAGNQHNAEDRGDTGAADPPDMTG